jgi:hypothetical protein
MAKKAPTITWSTIHIFGYGETQLIGNGFNKKVPTLSVWPTVLPVVDNVYSTKPEDNNATPEYHAVNIFYNMFADFQPQSGNAFRTQYADLDATLIEALVAEIDAYVAPEAPVTE